MSDVRLEGIGKAFGTVQALAPTDLSIRQGEFLTLLGPSGSGKTTLLNICAGYVAPSAGRLFVGGRDVTALPPRQRNMGMVFQNYALFPHMSVADNVAYGLKVRKLPRNEIARRCAEALHMTRLEGLGGRAIRELSGGQQQRVALARAMVIQPDILLMDEPLGALDRQLRKEVQLEIRRLHAARPRTTIYVTHDQEEALVMSDRIAVMRAGRIVQIGTGAELYERPVDTFVARFLGESNLLAGRVETVADGRATLAVPGFAAPLAGRAAAGLRSGQPGCALLRPEAVCAQPGGAPARIAERVYLGELSAVRLVFGSGQELWSRRLAGEWSGRDAVEVGWDASSISILPDASNES
ncbi:MAG: ABC transporter ATP-binding protein [Burkholderiales bacterium]|nr:ABC transporter ATP-binding protein [Burkholderiales bacterium]